MALIGLLVELRGGCAVMALARINKPVPPSDPLISSTVRHRISAAYWKMI